MPRLSLPADALNHSDHRAQQFKLQVRVARIHFRTGHGFTFKPTAFASTVWFASKVKNSFAFK